MCLFLFFFFQAEDGIRDSSVTGVQTCALPICLVDAIAVRSVRRASKGIAKSSVRNRGGSKTHKAGQLVRQDVAPRRSVIISTVDAFGRPLRELGFCTDEKHVGD